MAKVINCDCGLVCRGDTVDDVLAAAEAHIREDHPNLVGKLSRDDLLAMAEDEP